MNQATTLTLRVAQLAIPLLAALVGLTAGLNPVLGIALAAGVVYVVVAMSSLAVGLARGRLTRVWADTKGHVFSQGTAVTVALFLGLVAVKFGLGVLAWFAHINDGAGFGEVLIMIAIMIAVQAQIVHRRAETLTRAASRRVTTSQTSQRDHATTSV